MIYDAGIFVPMLPMGLFVAHNGEFKRYSGYSLDNLTDCSGIASIESDYIVVKDFELLYKYNPTTKQLLDMDYLLDSITLHPISLCRNIVKHYTRVYNDADYVQFINLTNNSVVNKKLENAPGALVFSRDSYIYCYSGMDLYVSTDGANWSIAGNDCGSDQVQRVGATYYYRRGGSLYSWQSSKTTIGKFDGTVRDFYIRQNGEIVVVSNEANRVHFNFYYNNEWHLVTINGQIFSDAQLSINGNFISYPLSEKVVTFKDYKHLLDCVVHWCDSAAISNIF